jgi:hypothetical protein
MICSGQSKQNIGEVRNENDVFDRIYGIDKIIWPALIAGQILHPLRGRAEIVTRDNVPIIQRIYSEAERCFSPKAMAFAGVTGIDLLRHKLL